MPKICYLTYQSFPSEKANTIQTISNLKYFVKNGYDVELIFPLREKNSSDKFEDLEKFYNFKEGIKITGIKHNYPFGKINFLEKLFFLLSHALWSRKIVKKLLTSSYKADVFFTRSEWISYFLSKNNKNVIYECHQLSKIKRILIPLILKNKKSQVIFLNQKLLTRTKLEKSVYSQITVLHNGVDHELFNETVDKNKNHIIFVGNLIRFDKNRNIDFLINSFKDKRLSKKYNLKIVGGPDVEVARLNKIIRNNNLEDKIETLGRLNRKKTIEEIEKAEIGLLINSSKNTHSTDFTSPLKYFEYLMGGLKVVAVDFPSHRVLPFSENINYFKENNKEEFIKSIYSASSKKAIAKRSLEDITIDSRVKKIIEIIEN